MTMQQLAQLAGTSVSTVSKAFADASDVSEATKQKILALAKEHGCYGKFYKNKFHKKVFAIIFPELESAYYIGYAKRLCQIIEQNGGIVLMSTDGFDADKQSELIDYYASFLNVSGIFVISLKAKLKRGYEIPIVALMSATESDSVNSDMHLAMTEAVSVLHQNGHQNIAFLGERLTSKKAEIFCEVCRLPINCDNVITSEFRFQKAGEDGINKLLDKPTEYTAIICAYDDIAYGAIRRLKKRGFCVPNDYSVIGIDNINFSEYTETPLTSIDMGTETICLRAWELMSKKLKNKFYRNKSIAVSAQLVMRETVAKSHPTKAT